MIRQLYFAIVLVLLACYSVSAQNGTIEYPQIIGYTSGQSAPANADSVRMSFHGGSVGISTWQSAYEGGRHLSGMHYGLAVFQNAFEKELFVSKGYYADYVELRWEVERYQSQITGIRIFRRLLGSAAAFQQVASIAPSNTNWRDEYAESGVMYEYKIVALGLFGSEIKMMNMLDGVGFRVPVGRVSGRITYAGGAAVEGVSVIADTDDDFAGSGLQLNGTDAYVAVSHPLNHDHFKFEQEFTFQAWLKPSNSGGTIFQKGNQYKITHTTGNIRFTANGTNLDLPFVQRADTFFNVTAIRKADSLKLYVSYSNEDTIFYAGAAYAGATAANNNDIYIGRNETPGGYYAGNIDEVRIWHKALTNAEVRIQSFMYIAGTESKLSAYYRMNEGVGNNIYDLSRQGFTFNEKHGYLHNTTWAQQVPQKYQLSVKAVTDASGNYLISGIPYKSDGSTYRIVPMYGVHTFDPTQRVYYIGPGSNTHSNVNFIDVASFPVQGRVFYNNTNFPVDGVQIFVDGKPAVTSGGIPITTNSVGEFTVDVPIGLHRLQMVKHGHVFRNKGFFPADSTQRFDFQQPYTIQTDFIDSTLIKVVGKVVGGPVQAAKPNGMGKTKNNIGEGKIVLTTQREYDLKLSGAVDINSNWINRFFKHTSATPTATGITNYVIKHTAPKQIEIYPDPTTGEYEAYLLPERYVVKSILAGNYTNPTPDYIYDNSFHTVLDLSIIQDMKMEVDSIPVNDFVLTPQGDTSWLFNIDSVKYHHVKNFIYRTQPTVTMKAEGGTVDRFWEEKVLAKNGTEVPIVSGDGYGQWLTDAPVFLQRKPYKTLLSVFEKYVNHDAGGVEDNVPVTDGLVKIQNALAINERLENYQIDEKGELKYSFTAGLPNVASSDGIQDFLKTMSVKVYTGLNGSIVTDWPSDGNGFKGYVFGGLPTGNNFVTTGPNLVDMIIRDPHGSNSFAFYESGNSISKQVSYTVENSESTSIDLVVSLGGTVKTVAGVPGAGMIIETENKADISAGIEQSVKWVNNSTSVETTTNTIKWSTSAEPDFVGADGDVFIGHSTNIVYGINRMLDLIPTVECSGESKCKDAATVGTYKVGLHNGLRINPEFNTAFQYTQYHIENNLIPNLKFLRNEFLKNKIIAGIYVSHINPDNEGFGKNNNPATLNRSNPARLVGDSYDVIYPPGYGPGDSTEFVDTVSWYNAQIKGWEDILAENEKEKLEATLIKNYSYDAGVVFESTNTTEKQSEKTKTFQWNIAPKIGLELGIEVSGIGTTTTMSASYERAEEETETETSGRASTFGFVLNDGDQGDYYSIDVKRPKSTNGLVFAVRGGQSKCPYVDEEVTKYHDPGKVLSAATMQREVPQLAVQQAIITNVASDRPANFVLNLSNISESGDDEWFMITINEQTNQNGANLRIDGASITNGRLIFIPAGQTINKILSLHKVLPDVYDYDNIEIILKSVCQDDIADTVQITAKFIPVCSSIQLGAPNDKWLVNTSDIIMDGTVITSIPLNINLRNYDLNHNTLQTLAVQYKASSSSQWVSDMIYYKNQADYDAANEPKMLIGGASSLNYTLQLKSLQDRNYDIRLRTSCADGTTNTSDIVSGIKDTKRPRLFGSPQPADGILSPGDEVMVTFDEDIQAGLLTSRNFSVRGVLNGAEIRHGSALFFDGVDDYAGTIRGVNLTRKSFTVEFWAKRTANTPGVLYTQGEFEIGFNASNQLYAKFGSQQLTTPAGYTITDDWMHWGISYDHDKKLAAFYLNDLTPVQPSAITVDYFEGAGRMYIGRNAAGTSHYAGYLHELRIWERARSQAELYANMLTSMNGSEVGLSACYSMDESAGPVAIDKARFNDAALYGASWAVFPRGYARVFTGASHLNIPTGATVVVNNEMDFTVEFWFKGAPQTNTVMFSNGVGQSNQFAPPFVNTWLIGTNADGRLYAQNNGVSLVVPGSETLFDNSWHHVALVLNRIGNTSLLVDGNVKVSNLSSLFGGLTGANMTIGARMTIPSAGPTAYDRYFVGALDEFRIWKLSRTTKLIQMDMTSKLKGSELGLVAYYPFDGYDINLVVQPDLNDKSGEIFNGEFIQNTLSATNTGTTTNNADVPNIKDVRPVQNLSFDWVVNKDKLIINIKEPADLIEKTIIEFTVENIEDLNENRLSSPATWTAYIKKNTMVWAETVFNFEKKLYDPLSFTVDILNIGGTEQNYQVLNLPTWLKVDAGFGSMGPDSRKTLRFTVDEGVNVGLYDVSIFLQSDFGFKEKLNLTLKVYAPAPDWTLNPADYEYSMSVIGEIGINGILSTNPDDKIAAIYTDPVTKTEHVRGVANLVYVPHYDRFMFFMDVYSNVASGETIDFKVWNASQGRLHVGVDSSKNFLRDQLLGMPSTPILFAASDDKVNVKISLVKGWNWISFPVNSPLMDKSSSLLKNILSTEGDIIKSQTLFDQFGTGSGWVGTITGVGGFNVRESYRIKVDKPSELQLVGFTVDASTTPIPVRSGWNWVGFVSQVNMPVNNALASLAATHGDIIKGQRSFAYYDQNMGWLGSLKSLKPTEGYMYRGQKNDTIIYPSADLFGNNLRTDDNPVQSPWTVATGYENTMSVVAEIDGCNSASGPQFVLGAFVGDECRGIVEGEHYAGLGKTLYFISVAGQGSGAEVTYKLYNTQTQSVLNATTTGTYTSNGVVGSSNDPFVISFASGSPCITNASNNGMAAGEAGKVRVHPNPFSDFVEISSSGHEVLEIKITDLNGKTVFKGTNTDENLLTDGKLVIDFLNDGVYIMTVILPTGTENFKLIKQAH